MTNNPKPNLAFDAIRAAGGPLDEQLAHYFEAMDSRNSAAGEAYREMVTALSAAKAGANAPKPGDRFPFFLLPDEDGHLVALADLVGTGPLVVSINRGNWCPFCWLELSAFCDIHEAICELGGEIVSITPETAVWNRQLIRRLNAPFHFLTDIDNGYALELGLAVPISTAVHKVYDKGGINLGLYQNNGGWMLPIPATFVVNADGYVRFSYVNADFRKRIDPTDILTTLGSQ